METVTPHAKKGHQWFRPPDIKVWETPSGEEPSPAELLTEGKGATEWVVGEAGGYKYHLLPHNQLQK